MRIAPVRVPGFTILYLAMFVISTGNVAMMSLFPAIARTSGIPDAVMVMVQSVSAGLSIFATPFWAARSDQVGRKPIILVGIAGFTVASVLTASAIFVAVHRLVPLAAAVTGLIASRALFGSVGLAAAPAIQAHVADETTPALRTRALSSMFSANGLGSIAGPGIAPFLILPWIGLAGPQTICALSGVAIIAVITFRLPYKPSLTRQRAGRSRKLDLLRQDTVWPFVAYMAVLSGCQAANLQMVGFVVIDQTGLAPIRAQPYSGMTIMAGAIAAVAIQLGVLRRFPIVPVRMMVCGLGIGIAGNLLMARADGLHAVAVAFIVSSAGYAFGAPAAAAGASLANPGAQQGGVAGMISAASSSGLLAAPVAAMLLYRYDHASAFLAIAAVLTLLLAAVVPRCAYKLPL